jgi:hypothetical protein
LPTPSASRWRCCGGIFDWDTAEQRLAELNKRAEDPKLWNDPQSAQKVMRQRQSLERSINAFLKLERDLDDAVTLIELGESEKDEATVREGEAALRKLAPEARRLEVEALLSGEADGNDTYLEVHAGAGRTAKSYPPQALHAADQGRERLRLAQDRIGCAPTGAHLALRQQRAPPHLVCQRVGVSRGRR